MKKYLTFSNIITVTIFAAVLYMQAPTWFANNKVEGKNFVNTEVKNIQTNDLLKIEKDKKYILFFWATWCAPCKVEMQRYQKSITEGKIPKDRFLAINPFETPLEVRKFLKKKPYPFIFVDDKGILGSSLGVRATPTATFIENGRVVRQSSGISLIGIFKAEWFFN